MRSPRSIKVRLGGRRSCRGPAYGPRNDGTGTKALDGNRRPERGGSTELGQNVFALSREQTLRNVLLVFQTELASNLYARELAHQRNTAIRDSDRAVHG